MVTVSPHTHRPGSPSLSHTLFLTLLLPALAPAQLVGQRGVISLPENFEYRDEDTRLAAEAVAGFAQQFQQVANREASLNQERELQQKNLRSESVDGMAFFTDGVRRALPGGNNDDFFHDTSRIIRPPPENAQRIDNEHPCTLVRETCDVPEPLLVEALRKKAQSPENEDGIINELDGFLPTNNVNSEVSGRLGGDTSQRLSLPPSQGSRPPFPAFLPGAVGGLDSTGTLQAFTTFGGSPQPPQLPQPAPPSHQAGFATFGSATGPGLGGVTRQSFLGPGSQGGGRHRAFGRFGHSPQDFAESNLHRSDSGLGAQAGYKDLVDVQSALEILGDDEGSFSSFVHFG